MAKQYLSQRVLLPSEHVGVKELGLVAFGSLVSTLLKIGASILKYFLSIYKLQYINY